MTRIRLVIAQGRAEAKCKGLPEKAIRGGHRSSQTLLRNSKFTIRISLMIAQVRKEAEWNHLMRAARRTISTKPRRRQERIHTTPASRGDHQRSSTKQLCNKTEHYVDTLNDDLHSFRHFELQKSEMERRR